MWTFLRIVQPLTDIDFVFQKRFFSQWPQKTKFKHMSQWRTRLVEILISRSTVQLVIKVYVLGDWLENSRTVIQTGNPRTTTKTNYSNINKSFFYLQNSSFQNPSTSLRNGVNEDNSGLLKSNLSPANEYH